MTDPARQPRLRARRTSGMSGLPECVHVAYTHMGGSGVAFWAPVSFTLCLLFEPPDQREDGDCILLLPLFQECWSCFLFPGREQLSLLCKMFGSPHCPVVWGSVPGSSSLVCPEDWRLPWTQRRCQSGDRAAWPDGSRVGWGGTRDDKSDQYMPSVASIISLSLCPD